jgi:hypothetical protein
VSGLREPTHDELMNFTLAGGRAEIALSIEMNIIIRAYNQQSIMICDEADGSKTIVLVLAHAFNSSMEELAQEPVLKGSE